MKVYIGADHRGRELADSLERELKNQGHDVEVVLKDNNRPEDDYVDFAVEAARKVVTDPENRGIVVCGSGVGVDIAANKIKGVRASLGYSVEQVKSARNDDDINMLALGADFLDNEAARKIVTAFFETEFDASERRLRRIDKIKALE